MKLTFNEKQVHELTRDEIKQAWDILKQAHRNITQREVTTFFKGQQVTFDHKGKVYAGTVQKTNQKSVTVEINSINGDPSAVNPKYPPSFNCSPSLLTKL